MAVAFLSSIMTERASSSSYATRQLDDMAVSIVQAQIQQASTQTGGAFRWPELLNPAWLAHSIYPLRLLPVHGLSVQGEWTSRHSNRKRHALGQLHYLAKHHGFKQSAEELFHHPGYLLTGKVAVLRP